ncbi:MAG: hypothetical protein HY689_04360 [Chloroflexi bacterium]|nr:hypothetical protein [Chloroflexota bacterium]
MARYAVVSTHGTEDPTRAALPFVFANGAVEGGHQATIILLGDATLVMKDVIAENITPVGWPVLKEHIATAVKNGIPIHV